MIALADLLLFLILCVLLMIWSRVADHFPPVDTRLDITAQPPTGATSGLKPPKYSAAHRGGRQPLI